MAADIPVTEGMISIAASSGRNGLATISHAWALHEWEMTPHQLRQLAQAAEQLADELEGEA